VERAVELTLLPRDELQELHGICAELRGNVESTRMTLEYQKMKSDTEWRHKVKARWPSAIRHATSPRAITAIFARHPGEQKPHWFLGRNPWPASRSLQLALIDGGWFRSSRLRNLAHRWKV
jgi:hypothetical protein